MGKILEQNLHCMDSLEEKVSVFYVDGFDFDHETTTDRFGDEDFGHPDYGSDNTNNNELLLHGQMERNLYWEAQEALLQEILERQSLTGQKLRQEVKRIIEMDRETEFCSCPKPSSDDCTYCLRRILVNRLCDKGFNATLCTSRWKHTKDIPGGSHEYIEVMAITPGRKKQLLPILIELEFRDQFEITKACDNYRKLVSQLPEYFIGKPEYLNAIVRILCDAAKRSMTEKKIYMGPWRKRSFMEMKWSYSFDKRMSLDKKMNKLPVASRRQSPEPCLHLSTARAVVVT